METAIVGKTASHPLRLLVSSVSIIVFVLSLAPHKGILVFSSPPASGDWIVTGTESYYDEIIELNGNLIVTSSGNLTFRKVTLKINCTYNGQYCIMVEPGGKFYVLENSIITSAEPDKRIGQFLVEHPSTFRMNKSKLFGSDELAIASQDAIVEDSLISHNRGGISIQNDGIVVQNCNVSLNDDCGISVHFSSPTIYNNTITSNFGSGICIHSTESSPLIQDNTISMNKDAGIFGDHNCSPIIQGNNISSNVVGIILIRNSSGIIQENLIASNSEVAITFENAANLTIQDNIITKNREGIISWNSSSAISDNLISENLGVCVGCYSHSSSTIANNTVTSNLENGIHCLDHSDATIQGNNITSNNGTAIVLNHHSTGIIEGNTITNNGWDGIALSDYSSPLIRGNIITSNRAIGIFCSNNSLPEIHWNDIYDNAQEFGGHGIGNEDPSVTINAIYNYWGNGPSTSSHVLYNPWLTESAFPFALAIDSPKSGITVGLTLVVRVQTSVLVDISRIEFYIQDVLAYTAYEMPYQWSWETTRYPNGEYIISAKAYDSSGNMKTCETTVTVENAESPWWEIHFWSIIQVLIGIGSLILGSIAYLARKERKKSK